MDFYSRVLTFREDRTRRSRARVDALYGVFGAQCPHRRTGAGRRAIELMQFLGLSGPPDSGDSRSNDRWFQHIAIIVSDMDRGYGSCGRIACEHVSTVPQTLPDWNQNAAGIQGVLFQRSRRASASRSCSFRRTRATPNGIRPASGCFSVSIIPRSSWRTPRPAWRSTATSGHARCGRERKLRHRAGAP